MGQNGNQFKGVPLKRYSIVALTMLARNLDRKRDNDFSFVLHRQIKHSLAVNK